MGVLVLTGLYLSVNAQDWTTFIKKAELPLEAASLDTTTMGTNGWQTNVAGLKSGSLSVELVDDFAASQIDALCWGIFSAGANVAFEMRPTQAAVGTSNPKLTGNLVPTQYKMGGDVGGLAMKTLQFPTSGAVARATS
jgi:hypothetical protein